MKEITTIHIARTPYEVELAAKKALGEYLDKIAAALHDDETYGEVEARIVDILREHKVARGDVITEKEVSMIMAQLGEPKDFIDESEKTSVSEGSEQSVTVKRFFRDQDRGLLGGVLAGIANYFGVDVIWIRLGWVILTLMSGGAFIVGYILLWVIMPPARTAAEKLQSRGEKVTLGALKQESSEKAVERSERSKPLVVLLRAALAIGFGLAAFGALALIAFVLGARAPIFDAAQIYPGGAPWVIAALGIMVVCGLLFTALMILLSYMSAAWRVTKRLVIVSGVIVALGTVLTMTAIGVGQYGLQLVSNVKIDSTTSTTDKLEGVSSAMIDSNVPFNYHVVAGQPRVTVASPQGSSKPDVSITKNGKKAVIKANCQIQQVFCGNSRVDIYGPVLEAIDIPQATNGFNFSYETTGQKVLRAQVRATSLELQGTINRIDASIGRGAVLTANYLATIDTLNATLAPNAALSLGDAKHLSVSVPTGCKADDITDNQTALSMGAIGQLTVNSKKMTAEQLAQSSFYCVSLNR